MMLSGHIIASGVTAAWFGVATKSPTAAAACFLGGIFIDLDHAFDFFLMRKRVPRSYVELVDFCKEPTGKIYLFLHSYELMALLWATCFWGKLPLVFVGALFGMSVHLLLDQLTNPVHPVGYFISYRIKLGFPKSVFLYNQLAEETASTTRNL